MKIFGVDISVEIFDLLSGFLSKSDDFETVNLKLFDYSGIKSFFCSKEDFSILKERLFLKRSFVAELDRTEYGDFQTNSSLSGKVVDFLKLKAVNPNIIVEPTCGKGTFIIAALEAFPYVEKIIGVEIYSQYVWETKFNILHFYLKNKREIKPVIEVVNDDVFGFDFKKIAQENGKKEILVIGNPPWVTNAKLGSLQSDNLPVKSNFKNHKGLDAMTGKGNFDIGEFISLMMFESFQFSRGHFAFLVKNAVIKNIVFDQKLRQYKISNLQKLPIDSKKEFNASVEASLFYCEFNKSVDFVIRDLDFDKGIIRTSSFGWVGNHFVSDIEKYMFCSDIEGNCQFEWRQGVKHDLSSVMDLEQKNGRYVNGFNETVELEKALVYAFLKSSDLKELVIKNSRKNTIITQKTVGESTSYIKELFPKTFSYLQKHEEKFRGRKSSIYKNKPDYSIFGIGAYSFCPFKVVISGFYKRCSFNLVLPQDGKPIMLDDTCYMLGFEDIQYAAYTMILLNSEKSEEFLKSITFSDAKRVFTKDVLKRIDLLKLSMFVPEKYIIREIKKLNDSFLLDIKVDKWKEYLSFLKDPSENRQMDIFEAYDTI